MADEEFPIVDADDVIREVAVDTVDGKDYQRIKLDLGADGALAPVVGTMPVSGTVTATISGTPAVTATISGTPAVTNTPSGDHTVVGKAAHDAAVSGNPVLAAGYASATAPTAVTAGDVARFWTNLRGAMMTAPMPATCTSTTAAVTTSSATALAAATGRVYVEVRNTSADPEDIIYIDWDGGAATSSSPIAISGSPTGGGGWFSPPGFIVTGIMTAIGTGSITLAIMEWTV